MIFRRGKKLLLPVLFLLLLNPAGTLAADKKTALQDAQITLDFQNVELVDLISTISELTGKNFVYDDGVRGQVSIVSPRTVSIDEAYRLFSTVLNVKGFTIIPSGKVHKIVPVRSAKETNLPISDGRGLGEQFITRIIKLKKLDATLVVDTILRPLMPKTSHVVAHSPTNTVVLTDSAANIRRLSHIITSLDRTWEGERMEILPLQYADAEEAAGLVMQILEGGKGTGKPVRGVPAAAAVRKKASGQVIPYGRTNKLMVLGKDGFIAQVRNIVVRLDERADLTRVGVHVYYLEHAEAQVLAETLNRIVSKVAKGKAASRTGSDKELFGDVTITADKPTNALIVNATAEDYTGIQGLISQLDIKRKQVFVEALILELTMDALLELGVSLQGGAEVNSDSLTFGTSNLNTGSVGLPSLSPGDSGTTPTLLTQAVSGILLGGLFNPITTTGPDGNTITVPALSALIQLSESDSDVNVLSAPRLLTSDNEEAEIVVGANVPIITSREQDNAGNPINAIERQDVALTLRFTPQVTEGELVRLQVYQEISAIAPTNLTVGDVNELGPTFSTRKLRNSIVARDGKTVVLGGLFQTDRQETVRKVPLLGDIPFLGALFRSTTEQEIKTSLLIFITPRVIRNSEDLEQITRDNRASLELFNSAQGGQDFFQLGRAAQNQFTEPVADQPEPSEDGD